MPISHVTKLFAVADCAISKMLTDPAAGSATYATKIDVPGIKTLEISGSLNRKQLRGDNQPLDTQVTLDTISANVSHAKLSLDALAVMIGSAVTDSGTTPNQVATMSLVGGTVFNYFKLEGKTPTGGGDTPTGDVHFVLWKAICTSLPTLGFAEEDYRLSTFTVECSPRISDGKILDGVINETAAVIV